MTRMNWERAKLRVEAKAAAAVPEHRALAKRKPKPKGKPAPARLAPNPSQPDFSTKQDKLYFLHHAGWIMLQSRPWRGWHPDHGSGHVFSIGRALNNELKGRPAPPSAQ